ncbi:integral membrane protein S linking to the trans Golgi network-domain-containing protein [Phascolomyces articulosus]|uniref:Integral membrane protein S linking to the trans Golgi network-domain-containing protein n=1 Tax=Phascolomyces articulosus TaxID=60185 RepID=A0AAD5JL75_9FUNG|nr:integral membrane protein S linking to the trans Golgi network-domain-containing protein [Phascolomyces articulosus]
MAQSSFRATGWDPILIIAQVNPYDAAIRTDTAFGWTLGLVWLVNATMIIPVLVFLVQRAKLVLDFVLTLHFFHILFVWIHTGHFPTCGAWWFLQVVNAILMTLGGEWACMRREMEPIMVSKKDTNPSSAAAASQQLQQEASGSTSSSSEIQEIIPAEDNVDWVHIGKKQKRKVSDPRGDEHHRMDEDDLQEDAPFTRAVGKAKKVILQGAQRAARSSSISRTPSTTNNKGKRYENIPLHDVDQQQQQQQHQRQDGN